MMTAPLDLRLLGNIFPHTENVKFYVLQHFQIIFSCGPWVKVTQIELKELLREPVEPFRHMAPSAPSKAPLVLCVTTIMAPSGAITHMPFELATEEAIQRHLLT